MDMRSVSQREKKNSLLQIKQYPKRLFFYILVPIVLLAVRVWLETAVWQTTRAHYVTLESVTAVLALFVGILALLRYSARPSNMILFLGTGFIGAGLLDIYHATIFSQTNLPLNAAQLGILWTWNASRIFLAIMLFGSWMVWQWETDNLFSPKSLIIWPGLIVAVGLMFFAAVQPPPDPASGFTLQWAELAASGLFFLLALIGYLLKKQWQEDWFEHWVIMSILIALTGQIHYLFYSTQLFDAMFTAATILKMLSYVCVLAGLLTGMLRIFRQAEDSAAKLIATNTALQREISERKKAEIAAFEQRQLAEALREVGNALSATLNFNQLLDLILDQIARVMPYGTANVMLVTGKGNEVIIASTRGYDTRLQNQLPPRFELAEMPTLLHMMKTGKPLIIPNTAEHPAWIQIETSRHVRSWAGTPIVLKNETVAFIALNNSQPNFYKLTDAARLSAFAGQAAIAIQNARLYAELERKVEELTTRNKINQAMSTTLDLEEILTIVTEQVTRLLGVDATSVVLKDEKQGDLWFAAASGQASEFVLGKRLPMGQGIMGWVAQYGQPLLVADVASDERYYHVFDQQSGFQARSIICVPLVCKGETIGAIEAINKADGPFDEEDVRLLSLMASPAATAIENAQLYKQAQQEIAERKRAEQALEAERKLLAQRVAARTADLQTANLELARAARLKDEFLASMSHELRTPLNAVLGMSEALQEGVFGEVNENQRQSLKSIEESGRHLLELINDILDLSKIEAGKLELELRPVALKSVCESSLRLVRQDAMKKRIRVHSRIDEEIELFVADERRLKQILVNLLSNAVKFTPKGGEIGLDVAGDKENHVVQFVVWDTGIGISEEGMKRLFQPFVQLDSRLSREYAGTGLGLSLVQRLAAMHGGEVSVVSEVGQGSRFTVRLPWRQVVEVLDTMPQESENLPDEDEVSDVPETEPLVLLVEDNEANIKTLSRYLRFKHYRVLVAKNGRQAVQAAQDHLPDIILMDIQMPGMDGLEATRRIRQNERGADVPIIALTALAMPGDQERCLAAGADAYLSKPVSLKQLSQTIERHLAVNK